MNFIRMGGWTEVEIDSLRERAPNGTQEEGIDPTGQEMFLLELSEEFCLRRLCEE